MNNANNQNPRSTSQGISNRKIVRTCIGAVGLMIFGGFIWFKNRKQDPDNKESTYQPSALFEELSEEDFTELSDDMAEVTATTNVPVLVQPKRKPRVKVTPEMVHEWKQLSKDGATRMEIAQKFNVSKAVVDKYLRKKTYKKRREQQA